MDKYDSKRFDSEAALKLQLHSFYSGITSGFDFDPPTDHQ